MRKNLLAVVTMTATLTSACATHVGVGYRAYDPYYSDYHVWGPDEAVYYNRWEVENHREHRDFRRLNRDDQHTYWNWRHTQPGPGRR